MNKLRRYVLNWLVWLDLGVNTLTGGSVYETISERCWRHQWKPAIKVIDTIFGWFGEKEHCRNSAEGDEQQYEVI